MTYFFNRVLNININELKNTPIFRVLSLDLPMNPTHLNQAMVDIYNRVGNFCFLFAHDPAIHIPGKYEWHQCSLVNDVVIRTQVVTISTQSITYYHFDVVMKVYRAAHLGIEQHQLAQNNNQSNPKLSWKLIRIY
ncbi:hypothetical protein HYC85_031965 [Camellia sinensis]|uniref:Uncharacterized protein n=1 Tax=Camellia sinensis TaxID=4442 RepID=A0A7J7FS20_CAMSI|nr:hypothetical protein HYC85_031965 [Camellia sinensis]